MDLDLREAPLETLEAVLPKLLHGVSIARAQIAIDQLRGAIGSKAADRIVLVTASRPDSVDPPLAAAIAIQQPSGDASMATIIHAGAMATEAAVKDSDWMGPLAEAMDQCLRQRGVSFVQWATDVAVDQNDLVSQCCRGFGFQPVGTLDYLNGDVPESMPPNQNESQQSSADSRLHFHRVELETEEDFERFAELVERTYQDTLDCPLLAEHRSAAQTLRGYQVSGAYDPRAWFRATTLDQQANPHSVGCMVLALHRPAEGTEADPVIEIVYMGLVPEARGQGLGRQLVEQSFAVARDRNATRMILAVDQKNRPARDIYESAGLTPMLSETVWVKSIT